MGAMTRLGMLAALLAGCGRGTDTDDTHTDADADTDAGTDAGTDTDIATDTDDTDTPDQTDDGLDVTGKWLGECTGVLPTGGPADFEVMLDLVEIGDDVTGSGELGITLGGPPQVATMAVAGTRTGSDLDLDVDLSLSNIGPVFTARFDLSVTVDTLVGQLLYYGGEAFDCALERDE